MFHRSGLAALFFFFQLRSAISTTCISENVQVVLMPELKRTLYISAEKGVFFSLFSSLLFFTILQLKTEKGNSE